MGLVGQGPIREAIEGIPNIGQILDFSFLSQRDGIGVISKPFRKMRIVRTNDANRASGEQGVLGHDDASPIRAGIKQSHQRIDFTVAIL